MAEHRVDDGSLEGAAVIDVEVVHALAGLALRTTLHVPRGTTAGEALALAAVLPGWPERLENCQLGVFSRRVDRDHPLRDGDRLECYRPLQLDPKAARRQRASRAGRS